MVETPTAELAVVEEQATGVASFAVIIEKLAANPSVDVAKLEKIIAMQERILAANAKSAFNAAFAEMQGQIPVVVEKGKTDKGTYAPQEDIVEVVQPILTRHGFSLSFRTEWPDKTTVRVIGILTHRDGHERTSEFLSDADKSGSKNSIQALGSAVTYGRRYTTTDLLNITTRKADDDGRLAGNVGKAEVSAPDGYDGWLTDMEAVADEGIGKLTAAWNKSKAEYRAFIVATNKGAWDRLKAKASKVTA